MVEVFVNVLMDIMIMVVMKIVHHVIILVKLVLMDILVIVVTLLKVDINQQDLVAILYQLGLLMNKIGLNKILVLIFLTM